MRNPFHRSKGQSHSGDTGTAVVNAWEVPSPSDSDAAGDNIINSGYPSPVAESRIVFDEKTEDQQPSFTNAPQDEKLADDHGPVSPSSLGSPITITPSPFKVDVSEDRPRRPPSKARIILRVWQLIASVGAFGFQVGATPYSGQAMPFPDNPGLLYYVYAINWVSAIWTSFTIHVYLTRRFGDGGKVKRVISFLMDALLAALFGVGTFFEFALYQCPPGQHNGWCDFLNTGLFFLLLLFTSYGVHALWDVFGGMSCLRDRN